MSYLYPFWDVTSGSFIPNNPTIDTMVVIQKLFPEAKMNAVISLGCGFIPPKLCNDTPQLGRLIDRPCAGLLGNADWFEKAKLACLVSESSLIF